MARQCEVVLSSVLLAAMLFGMTSNFFGHHYMQLIPAAVAQENKNATTNNNNNNNSTSTNKTITNNIVQLSVKEVTSGVYKWINGSNGADNPTLKAFTNANNIIKIQNPTDTKHELIIDTGADILPSSDDISPNGSGQLSFNPNMTGTFTYHCAYHPYTMKGTIEVLNK
jgi:plastocyanin